MKKHDSRSPDGQTLIIIALMLVGMLVFAGLILDGANAYASRRQAQNAADAGALAGARELAERYSCEGSGSAMDDTAIARRINEYAERNGIPDSNGSPGDPVNTNVRRRYIDADGDEIDTAQDIGQVGYVPMNAVGVHVGPSTQAPTFFMGIIGFNQVGVAALAEARVGVIKNFPGGSILPIALDLEVARAAGNGDSIRIWDKEVKGVEFREGASGNGNTNEWQQCGQRGWLNLKYVFSEDDPNSRTIDRNHGNNPNDGLRYYCCNDYNNMIYAGTEDGLDGDFINGDPGTRNSAIMELNCRLGQTVVIPIYDHTYSSNYLDAQGFPEPDIGWVSPPGGQGSGLIYHIVGFAVVVVTELDHQNHYVQTEFTYAVMGGGIDPTSTPEELCNVGLRGVGLTR